MLTRLGQYVKMTCRGHFSGSPTSNKYSMPEKTGNCIKVEVVYTNLDFFFGFLVFFRVWCHFWSNNTLIRSRSNRKFTALCNNNMREIMLDAVTSPILSVNKCLIWIRTRIWQFQVTTSLYHKQKTALLSND